MGWSKHDPRQGTLGLQMVPREPTLEDLRAAYEFCVADKEKLPFAQALLMPPIAVTLKTLAKKAILRRGGM